MGELTSLVIGLAGLFTAYTAATGVKAWKDKLKGETEYEVARNFLEAVFAVRDSLWDTRIPLIRPWEFAEDAPYPGPNTTPAEKALAYNKMFGLRSQQLRDDMKGFNKMAVKAEVLWGSEVADPTDDIRRHVSKWFIAVESHVENELHSGKDFEADKEHGKRVRQTLFASRSSWKPGENEFSDTFMNTISRIESVCRSRMTLIH